MGLIQTVRVGLIQTLRVGLIQTLMGGAYSDFLAFWGLDLNGSIVCLTMAFAIGLGPYPGLTAANALPGG